MTRHASEPAGFKRHTCGGPTFGRLAQPGACPRCDELRNGAPARESPIKRRIEHQALNERVRRYAIANHDCAKAGCGPICTFGDW